MSVHLLIIGSSRQILRSHEGPRQLKELTNKRLFVARPPERRYTFGIIHLSKKKSSLCDAVVLQVGTLLISSNNDLSIPAHTGSHLTFLGVVLGCLSRQITVNHLRQIVLGGSDFFPMAWFKGHSGNTLQYCTLRLPFVAGSIFFSSGRPHAFHLVVPPILDHYSDIAGEALVACEALSLLPHWCVQYKPEFHSCCN